MPTDREQTEADPVVTIKPRHFCSQPTIGALTMPLQPDWTCAACGRIWRDSLSGPVRWWAEVRGPTHFPKGETL